MNNRANIPLIVVFFAGLLGLYWADYARIPDRQTRRLAEARVLPELVSVRPDDIRRVEIAGGAAPIVFERREGNRWQMTAPIDTAADPSMVETLAFNLKELAKTRDVGTLADNTAKYGLQPPARTVRLYGSDSSRPIVGLDVGAVAFEKRYVRPEGSDGVEVVDAKALAAIELPPARWRDRSLMRFSTFQAESLAATGPGRDLKLDREGDVWHVRSPYKALADVHRVEGILGELTALRVADGEAGFVADDVKDLAAYGLEQPTLSITVQPKTGSGGPQTIHFGKPGPGSVTPSRRWYYARRDDQNDVVIVDVPLLMHLGETPAELHGTKVADIRPDRVDFLRLTSGGATVTASRTDKGWVRLTPLADRADFAAINDLLRRIDNLEASVLLDEKTAPDPRLDKPTAIIEVWQGAGRVESGAPTAAPSLRLTIGRVDPLNKTAFARTEGDPIILGLPSVFLDGMTLGSLAFRDRQVAATIPSELDRVAIVQGAKSVTIVHPAAGADPTTWRLSTPVSAPADPEAVGRLLHLLSDFRADTLITGSPSADATYGFDKPTLTATWTTKVDPPLRADATTLTVGGTATGRPGSRYARVSSSPIVFTMGPETLALFEMEWRDRRILSFPIRRVDRITIKWPSVAISARPIADVKTKDPEWTLIDPPAGIDFDPGRFKPLVTALSNLMTFRYAQYDGPIAPETGLFPGRFSAMVHLDDGSTHTLRLGNRTSDGYLFATMESGPSGPVFQLPLSGWEPWIKPPGTGAKP